MIFSSSPLRADYFFATAGRAYHIIDGSAAAPEYRHDQDAGHMHIEQYIDGFFVRRALYMLAHANRYTYYKSAARKCRAIPPPSRCQKSLIKPPSAQIAPRKYRPFSEFRFEEIILLLHIDYRSWIGEISFRLLCMINVIRLYSPCATTRLARAEALPRGLLIAN